MDNENWQRGAVVGAILVALIALTLQLRDAGMLPIVGGLLHLMGG